MGEYLLMVVPVVFLLAAGWFGLLVVGRLVDAWDLDGPGALARELVARLVPLPLAARATLMRRVKKAMRGGWMVGVSGERVAAAHTVVRLAPEDFPALVAGVSSPAFAMDVLRAYIAEAVRAGCVVRGEMSLTVQVTHVVRAGWIPPVRPVQAPPPGGTTAALSAEEVEEVVAQLSADASGVGSPWAHAGGGSGVGTAAGLGGGLGALSPARARRVQRRELASRVGGARDDLLLVPVPADQHAVEPVIEPVGVPLGDSVPGGVAGGVAGRQRPGGGTRRVGGTRAGGTRDKGTGEGRGPVLVLRVMREGRVEKNSPRLRLTRDSVMGRDVGCEVVFTSELVSSVHAAVRVELESWVMEDLGSLNGTTVDEVVLVPGTPVRLKVGSVVRLGAGAACFEVQRCEVPGRFTQPNQELKREPVAGGFGFGQAS